ncbi:MAG: sugar phosphate isomerase/epimerase, partial [Candidatus Bipolaricaulota bacterium]
VSWPLGLIVPLQNATPFSPFAPREWREAMRRVKDAGFDGVELAITDPDRVDHSSVAKALDADGLRLLSITTGQAAALEGLSLSSSDDGVRHRAVERIERHMFLAASFDAVVIVGSLRGADGDRTLLTDSLRRCAALNPEIKLAFEPLNRYESRLVNTVEESLRLLDDVGADNLGLLFDTFHANIEEPSVEAALQRAGERLFHVHLADSNRWVPGHGHTDFRGVWQALERIDYRSGLIVEALPRPEDGALLSCGMGLRSSWETADA